MANWGDVRRIARALPSVREALGGFAFSVDASGKEKGFAWVWKERLDPKKPRVPNPRVIAVRVRNLEDKAALLAGDSRLFFTEPHYNGFPAVLVRLPAITPSQLRSLLVGAWRAQAPAQVAKSIPQSSTKPASRAAARRKATTRKV
jgi:hypothetical protein